ncbi:MAG: glycine cleavage system protein H [Planctomycetes bacterium]|jgi:glycine cleavage system H protein|nr:glycine cleavage system protein H [Planctomycetota bacterium]
MGDDKVFEIGKHRAVLPGGLLYAPANHLWCAPAGHAGAWRFGFTSYALALMKDIYFLDWSLSAGMRVAQLGQIGHIETSKAESDLYSPMDGVVERFNDRALADPAIVNADGYGDGWLYEIAGDAEPARFVGAAAYLEHLHANWENTQRMIKGGMNRIVDEPSGDEEA